MIRSIIEAGMKLKFLVLIVVLGLLYLGVTQLRGMSQDVLPEFDPPMIEIQTEALGLSAVEVEELITTPMEADLLAGVAWIKTLYSNSLPGLSSIVLTFEPGTELIRARQMVQERLIQAHALPNVSKPPTMLQPVSSTSRVMMVGMTSEELSLIDMSLLARWTIVPRLMGVPGVANVAIFGQRQQQLQVQVDPKDLNANGVTLEQIISTSGNALWVSPLSYLTASTPGTGGWIDTPNQRLGVRHLSPISTAEDLAQVTVEGAENLRLGDVATVVQNHQPLIGDALINNQPGLLLVVEKLPGTNTLEVTRGVEEALTALSPGMKSVTFDESLYEPADYIDESNDNLRSVIIVSSILVFLVLLVFLFNWRSAVVSLLATPLALLAALLVLYYRGATFNVMVLAGLVVALVAVIDDVVIGVELITRRLHENRQANAGKSVAQVILGASLEIRRPMFLATLILLAAAIPAVVLAGLAGAFLKPLVLSYALAIFASLLVAMIVTPALSLLLFSLGANGAKTNGAKTNGAKTNGANVEAASPASPLAKWLQGSYAKGFLGNPLPAFIVAAALIVGGLFVVPQLRQRTLLPELNIRTLVVNLTGQPGASQSAMTQVASKISGELETIPGVTKVAAHVGRAITSDIVANVNTGELWVTLDPAANYHEVVDSVQEVVRGYPGLLENVTTYVRREAEAAQSTPANQVTVRVYGNDLDLLTAKAEEISAAVAKVGGIGSAYVKNFVQQPQLQIEVDLARAEAYGLKPGDVRRAAATLVSGVEVGSLFEDQKVFDVIVWSKPEIRSSIADVGELLIDTPNGDQVKIKDVADLRVVPTPVTVQREGVSRYIDVIASVNGSNIQAVANKIRAVIKGIEFPTEFHAELLSDYAESLANGRNLLWFTIGTVVIIFLLLQSALRSWGLAAVAFIGIATSVAGGFVVAGLTGNTNVIGLWSGLLATLGIAARHIIMQISQYQRLEQGKSFSADVVLQGTRERLLPLVITTLAVVVALLPLIFRGSVAGLELVRPLAVFILGGVISSAFASLFVIPALYLRYRVEPEPEFDFAPTDGWLPLGRTSDATD
jgi:Cu/Ag efflux pump CusA